MMIKNLFMVFQLSFFLLSVEAYAKKCQELRTFNKFRGWTEDSIEYWFDGFLYSGGPLKRRGYLSVLLKHQQTEKSFVEKVLLVDGRSNRLIEARYFESSDRMAASKFPPYLIFNNISRLEKYYLLIQIRESSIDEKTEKKTEALFKYRYVFTNKKVRKGSLLNKKTPIDLQTEIRATQGFVNSPFAFLKNPSDKEILESQFSISLLSLDRSGLFTLSIGIHKKIPEYSYVRSILVTDPVGRVLAYSMMPAIQPSSDSSSFVTIQALTESERMMHRILPEYVANINECPFLMVFVDYANWGVMKRTLWLR